MTRKLHLKKGVLATLLLASLSIISLDAQSLYLMKNDQSLLEYTTSSPKSLSFHNDKFIIKDNGVTHEILLSEIRYISFENNDLTTNISDKSSKVSIMSCYPNPADNELNLELNNATGNISIEILSTSGQIVLKEQSSFSNNLHTINVSGLESGIYLCKATTEEAIKMTSFIKQ